MCLFLTYVSLSASGERLTSVSLPQVIVILTSVSLPQMTVFLTNVTFGMSVSFSQMTLSLSIKFFTYKSTSPPVNLLPSQQKPKWFYSTTKMLYDYKHINSRSCSRQSKFVSRKMTISIILIVFIVSEPTKLWFKL